MRRHRSFLVLIALLVFPLSAWACLNAPPVTDREGRSFEVYHESGEVRVKWMTAPRAQRAWLSDKRWIVDEARKRPDFDNLTRLGVLLVYQGRYPAAIQLFLAIERLHPGRHETAANLGTALELMGRDTLALRWIREGIRRDAREHEGTEWLHARILEAKMALARDPHALDGRSVAGVTFADALLPPLPTSYPAGNDGRPVKPHELERAFSYQLRERLPFVPPKDAVVANLLMDWATLHLSGGSIEDAQAFYRLALRYGARGTPMIDARLAYIARTLAQSRRRAPEGLGHCPICEPSDPPEPSPMRTSPPRKPGAPPPPPPPPPPTHIQTPYPDRP